MNNGLKNIFNQTSEVSEIAIDRVRQDYKNAFSGKDPMMSLLGDSFLDLGLEEMEPTKNELIFYEKVVNKILSFTNYKVISEEITGDQANVEVLSSTPNYLILIQRRAELFLNFLIKLLSFYINARFLALLIDKESSLCFF